MFIFDLSVPGVVRIKIAGEVGSSFVREVIDAWLGSEGYTIERGLLWDVREASVGHMVPADMQKIREYADLKLGPVKTAFLVDSDLGWGLTRQAGALGSSERGFLPFTDEAEAIDWLTA